MDTVLCTHIHRQCGIVEHLNAHIDVNKYGNGNIEQWYMVEFFVDNHSARVCVWTHINLDLFVRLDAAIVILNKQSSTTFSVLLLL